MSDIMLGKLITANETAERDAIHVAIAPVTAGETLLPGTHVGLAPDGRAIEKNTIQIGIVDPYLTKGVRAGERFWLCLYPKTITNLRHNWTHPAFDKPLEELQKSLSMRWIEDYASELGLEGFELIDAARSYVEHGDYFIQGGRFEGVGVRDEFWPHFQAVTGLKGEGSFFSCSC